MYKSEKNHKELLTKEKMQQDYFNQNKPDGFLILLGFVYALLTAFVGKIAVSLGETETYIMFFFMVALGVLIFVVPLIFGLKTYIKVKKGDFVIVTDTLAATKEKTGNNWRFLLMLFGWRGMLFANPYIFSFQKYGKYSIVNKEVYTFSENYKMRDDSFYNSSHISDKYYLAICGKTIILAYNQNQFEMNEEPHC